MTSKVLPSLKRIPRKSPINLSVPESLKTIINYMQKIVPLGQTPLAELDLKWKGEQDYREIKYILQDILEFPSTDMADMHRDCNRLGTLDILENQSMLSKMLFEEGEPEIYCSCCGYLLQSQEIPIETSLRNIGNMGISTHLYFQTLILISILLGLLFCIYGIFVLVTNVMAFNQYTQRESIPAEANYLTISISAKQLHQTEQNTAYYFIQCWLGLVVVVIWFVAFILAKSFEQNDEILIDNRTKSAADFSIVIQGVPTKMTEQQLQKQLDAYYDQLTQEQKPKQIDRPFKIAKINTAIPFYLTLDQFINSELKHIIEQKNRMREKFVSWILQRKQSYEFSTPKNQRVKAYNQYRGLENDIQNHYRVLVDQIVEKMIQKKHIQPTTSVFITFETNFAKDLICHLNSPEDAVFTLKDYICWEDSSYFNIKYEDQTYKTQIKSAPEPEDIIWTNIGQSLSQMVLRKLLTYSITAIILGGSFAIIFILSREQVKNNNDAFLSFVISFSITIINIIIQVVLRVLTNLERQVTQTQFQTNLALKSIIAQLINSILLPFVVKHYIQHNLYKTDGLAFVVFSMGITNALVMPAVKLINLDYLIFMLKAWIYKKVVNKLNITQTELNGINTLIPFQTGNQYIYPVNLYLFVCFYATLQPIICVFGLAGLCLMYWVQKHALFTRSKRPYPGNDLVNRAMYRIMYFGPFVFSLGNLTWSNLIEGGGPQSALVPNLIAISISAVFMLVPYKGFFSRLIKQKYGQEMRFEENRIYLTSEYDRLNPATAKQAMNEYYKFLREYKQKIQNLSKEELLLLEESLLTQKQKGNTDTMKLYKIFAEVILDKPTQEEENKLQKPKQQSSYQDNLSMQENHIIIKQDSIEELIVKKKKKKDKNLVTADQLFKQFCVAEQNTLTFVQNWMQQFEQPTLHLLMDNLPKDPKLEQPENNNSDVKVDTINLDEKKKQIKVPEFKINKRANRGQMNYDLLKNLLKGYSKQVKAQLKDEKKEPMNKPSRIQNEDELKIETNRHEESRFKLNVPQENNKNGFLSLILNEGATLIPPSNTK